MSGIHARSSIKSIDNLSTAAIHPVVGELLSQRGLISTEDQLRFLHPTMAGLHSPFLMKEMDAAVARVRQTLDGNEKIGIYGDSDIDGITSMAVMETLFLKLNQSSALRYPQNGEPYGLSMAGIDDLHSQGVRLLLTVDCGIRDIEVISYARSLGMDVIVTDHHEPGDDLPDALILNPKLQNCSYPFRDLAGVGVALKLAHGILLSYLPAYSVSFGIVWRESGGDGVVRIHRGVTEVMHDAASVYIEAMKKERLPDGVDYLLVHGFNDAQIPAGKEIHTFADYINRMNSTHFFHESMNAEDFARAIYGVPFPFPMNEIITDVFLDAQHRASPRIRELLDTLFPLAALGSIADVMPLTGENRTIVAHGLTIMNDGTQQWVKKFVSGGDITAHDVSWKMAPLLNAPGRMGDASLAVEFVRSIPDISEELMNRLQAVNSERRKKVLESTKQLRGAVETIDGANDIILFHGQGIPDGVAGLVANRLSDDIGKPVIVICDPDENGICKGSGRGTGRGQFFSDILHLDHLCERMGGHEQAFGFSIQQDKIGLLKQHVAQITLSSESEKADTVTADIELDIKYVEGTLAEAVASMGPFGQGNEEPLFLSRSVRPQRFQRMGKDGRHGKYFLQQKETIEVIGWGMADLMEELYNENVPVDMMYHVARSAFRGVTRTEIFLKDLRSTMR